MRSLVIALVFLSSTLHAQTCGPDAVRRAATKALALQHQLVTASTPVMWTDVPPPLRPILHDFKQALIDTVDTELRCDRPEPPKLQTTLLAMLHANQPEKPFVPVEGPPWPATETGDYADAVKVFVRPQRSQPDLYSIQITYSIECGTDNILFFYRRTPAGWKRELLWKSPDFMSIDKAFGDMYLSPVVPPGPGYPYLVAVIHGTSWCSSNMSAFHIDLLAPDQPGKEQKLLSHLDQGFRREDEPQITVTPDGFDLRVTADDRAGSIIMRPGVFRYRTNESRLERVQPIALNARDFVDEWLQVPWPDAARWSQGPKEPLRKLHDRFDYAHSSNTPNIDDYSAVRSCSSKASLFQVEIDLLEGAKGEKQSTLFAKVRQHPNSFTMLSIDPHADPTCNGPDLMKSAMR